VRRLRALTSAQAQRLETTRRVARMLDSAVAIPGTSIRVGLDPILGLFPGLGDFLPPLFTIAVLWQGYQLGIPRVVQARMLLNVAIDACVGLVPGLGDLFDVAWKANTRNFALLEQHAYEERAPTRGDRLFVGGLIALVVALAAAPAVILYWLVTALAP
jgi:hypothetical protein